MSDKHELENSGSTNTTPEGKIAKEVATQFLAKKVGRQVKNTAVRKEVEVLLRLTDEIENIYDLNNMCKRLNVHGDNAGRVFSEITEEIFYQDTNWGRIVMVYAFAGKLAEHCAKTNDDNIIDKIAGWTGVAISKRSSWIRNSGHGWNGFLQLFGNRSYKQEGDWFQGVFAATIGLGTLAAALFIKS